MIRKAVRKIDWVSVLIKVWGALIAYVLIPLMVWVFTLEKNFNLPIDANTFWAVMAVFLTLRILKILNHLPWKIEEEPLGGKDKTK